MQATALGSALEGVQGGTQSECKHITVECFGIRLEMKVSIRIGRIQRANTGKVRGNSLKKQEAISSTI